MERTGVCDIIHIKRNAIFFWSRSGTRMALYRWARASSTQSRSRSALELDPAQIAEVGADEAIVVVEKKAHLRVPEEEEEDDQPRNQEADK